MPEKRRPTGKDVLDGIIQAMYDAQEPLDEDLILVPSTFDVLLHPEAYQELKSLMPRIREQAQKRLDQELHRLNSRRRGFGFFRRLFQPLKKLLFADRYRVGAGGGPATYECAADAWHVDFGVTAEVDVELDYLAVETDFGGGPKAVYKGRPTINIRRHTKRLPDGRFETVITARRPARETRRSQATSVAVANVLARLSFEDNQGRHIYYMKKEQIIVGRLDDPAHYLDVALDTLPDVSREHLRIRHDVDQGGFSIKDVSQYGVTVNSEVIASSLNEEKEDINRWHPLPQKAEIGLAGALFIHFEAL